MIFPFKITGVLCLKYRILINITNTIHTVYITLCETERTLFSNLLDLVELVEIWMKAQSCKKSRLLMLWWFFMDTKDEINVPIVLSAFRGKFMDTDSSIAI